MPKHMINSGNVRQRFRTVIWFLAGNLILSLLLNTGYIIFTPVHGAFWSTIYLILEMISNVLMLYLLISLPLFVIILLKNHTLNFVFSGLWMGIFQLLNITDLGIYRIFRIHINSMVLNLVFTKGAGDSLHLGAGTLLLFALIIAVIFSLEFWWYHRMVVRKKDAPIPRKLMVILLCTGLIVILADKSTYAVADLYNQTKILRYNKIFPLYQPLTIKRMVSKRFGFQVNRESFDVPEPGDSGLNYPLESLRSHQIKEYQNILWIVIDAMRWDMLSPERAPNLWEFARQSLVFKNHYSGGNATRFGVFSLFYGIDGHYWHRFLGERQSPVFMDFLRQNGYDFKIVSSSKLTNPEFRKTVFIHVPSAIVDSLPGSHADVKDPELTSTFSGWLTYRNSKKPFFAFLFYDAPHGPYSYPDAFDINRPSNRNPNYLLTGKKDREVLFNSYKNAVRFDDNEAGKILEVLREKNLLDHTIVLITADHGEEFYEAGFWGHTSSYSKYQTKVPLILWIPGMKHKEVHKLTSHLDVVPTMLQLLGVDSNPNVYSHGHSLLDSTQRQSVIISGWDDCAITDDENTLVFSYESYNLNTFEVRDSLYRIVPDEHKILSAKRNEVMQVLKGFSTFLR